MNFRRKCFQIPMLLAFEIFGRAGNLGVKFPKLSQTSFSGIVYSGLESRFLLHIQNLIAIKVEIDDYAKDGGPGVV